MVEPQLIISNGRKVTRRRKVVNRSSDVTQFIDPEAARTESLYSAFKSDKGALSGAYRAIDSLCVLPSVGK